MGKSVAADRGDGVGQGNFSEGTVAGEDKVTNDNDREPLISGGIVRHPAYVISPRPVMVIWLLMMV